MIKGEWVVYALFIGCMLILHIFRCNVQQLAKKSIEEDDNDYDGD